MDTARSDCFEFNGFRLDRRKWSLLDPDGNAVGLTPKAFDALVYFLEHQGEVIGRSTLLEALWPDTIVEENNLSQLVAALRRALGDGFIVTVPRRGYQFVAEVRAVAGPAGRLADPAGSAPGPGQPAEVPIRPMSRAGRRRASLAISALVLVIAVVFAVAGRGLLDRSPRPVPRIAVLPFVDASPLSDREYVADGIATELTTTLSRIDGLAVTGRSSSFYFKDHTADLGTIGEMLGVDYVLQGDVLSVDDRLRISVRLTEAASGTLVWADSYDRVVDDYFALQDDIARSVGQALELTLGVGDLGTRIGTTRKPRAFLALLKADQILRHGNRFSPRDVREAIPYLEQAVALDDTFALAWFELYYQSRWLNILATDRGASAPGAAERAQEALARVIELRPDLPELAVSRIEDGADAYQIARTFERFLDAAEAMNYPPVAILLAKARYLLFTGRVAESTALLERARVLDPLDELVIRLLAERYAADGRPTAALDLLDGFTDKIGESLTALDGTALVIALQTGDKQEIVERVAALGETGTAVGSETYAHMAALIDEPESALAELRAFAAAPDRRLTLWPTMLAPWAAYFGDDELALEMYRHDVAFATGNTISRPNFGGMRRLAGFKDLVRDKGLLSYWRESGNWPDYCRPLGRDDFECF